MDSAPYKIEILHHLNPHLLWIERKDQPEIILEQIGIFGLLPLTDTIDIESGKVTKKKAEEWKPAVNVVMKDFFEDNNDLYFEAIHIDRRSSIFNDNIHKFGDIFTLQDDDSKTYLSTFLINLGYCYQNENEFFQKLSTGNIKTKLNIPETNKVIMAIENYMKTNDSSTKRNKAVETKTSMFRAIKHMGQALTAKNLELHNRNQDLGHIGNVSKIIEQKTKDLFLCKVENEKSVGRGTSRLRATFSDVSNSSAISPKNLTNMSPDTMTKTLENRSKQEMQQEIDLKKTLFSRKSSSDKSSNTDVNENDSKFDKNDKNTQIEQINEGMKENFNYPPKEKKTDLKKGNTGFKSTKPYLVAYGPPMIDRKTYKIEAQFGDEESTAPMDLEPKTNEDIVQVTSKLDVKSTKVQKIDDVTGDINEQMYSLRQRSCQSKKNCKMNENNIQGDSNLDESLPVTPKLQEMDEETGDREQQIRNLRVKLYQSKNIGLINEKTHKVQGVDKVTIDKNDVEIAGMNKVKTHETMSFDCKIRDRETNRLVSSNECSTSSVETEKKLPVNSFMQKKLKMLKDLTVTVTKVKNSQTNTDSDEEINEIKKKLNSEYELIDLTPKPDKIKTSYKVERNVNPFKNLDVNKSVFVDKLVSPILMVHTKNDSLVLPKSNLRDIPFRSDVYSTLKNLQVKEPSRLQSVSWPYILKGHSIFMISPAGSGKTMGYVPAICNLVTDNVIEIESVGPICIIVCATARSVSDVSHLCKLFLGLEERVLTCFHGIDLTTLTTSVLNGCDILVCTPPMLYKLLITELGVDLRRLATLVFDDCERLTTVYESELKTIQYYVKEMLKNRSNKKLKVQYIMASRTWCDFMKKLAKKIPDTIVAIAAFQECVLYSKTNTSVEFVLNENKLKSVKDFLGTIDKSKRTVIVCRFDDEVTLLEAALSKNNTTFACNNTMTLHDLYNLNVAWSNYRETLTGPVLICCDGNLTHLNVVDANYLVHYSMPELFSMFCKRFAVLNENYTSIFSEKKNDVRIKILIEENNVEQLPKILNFIKRCTSEVPDVLEEISRRVLEQKDLAKAEKLVPLCDTMMAFSECSDIWNCQERHAILKGYDEPKDWMPRDGNITFKILHYHTAVMYSASVLSHITNNDTIKYPKTYRTLSLKMGMYFSKESNRKSHGVPKVGDICAVALKQNLYARCQVLKILSYVKGNPQDVLVRMIDEEQLETVRDIHLYYLPAELKNIETHTVKIRLANIGPQDKDVTFSDLACNQLKKITDNDEHLYMRGKVVLTVGNTIFVDTLEACQDLTTLNKTVVKHNFKDTLLEFHAKVNPDHIVKLRELCNIGGLEIPSVEISKAISKKVQRNYRWAHLPKDEILSVIFSYAVNPSKFFVRLCKFQKCNDLLISDIKKYVAENPKPLETYEVGDVVLAEFPDDKTYERARIEAISDKDEVTCFFVDSGDFLEVSTKNLRYIPRNFIEQIPFQAIECRLIGLEPPTENWTVFSTNWLCDMCFEDSEGGTKQLYLKYFTKEKAEVTGGNKYGVLLVDTNTEKDLVINKLMVELNLAREKPDELEYLNQTLEREIEVSNVSDDNDDDNDWEIPKSTKEKSVIPFVNQNNSITGHEKPKPLSNLFQPIRSVPLVDDNISLTDCDINIDDDLAKAFGLNQVINSQMFNTSTSDESNKDTSEDENAALDKIRSKLYTSDQMFKSKKDKYLSVKSIEENKIESQNKTKIKEFNNNTTIKVENIVEEKDTVKEIVQKPGINKEIDIADEKLICEVDKKLSDMNEKISYFDEKVRDGDKRDVVDGNIILKSKEPEETEKIAVENTNPIASELEKPQSIRRKGSAEDPNIIMDEIQELSATKSNIFKLFAKTRSGLLERRINTQTDKHNDTKSDTISTEDQNDTKTDTISIGNTSKTSKSDLDSDDLSSVNVSVESSQKVVYGTEEEASRKPKLLWRQNKKSVTIKIQLIGVETYALEIHERSLIFFCYHNDVPYEFQIELYGVIKTKTSSHANKGQYIQVHLEKILKTAWLNLTKDSRSKKWIVYDVDSIDGTVSSDEETAPNDDILKKVKEDYEKDQLDSDDDDFMDDEQLEQLRYRKY